MKEILLTIILSSLAFATKAQNVSGRITDSRHKAVAYASIVLKKSADSAFVAGAVSGEDGSFSIPSADGGAGCVAVVSFLGYDTKTVNVKPGAFMNIELTESTRQLDEVVAIGRRTCFKAGGYSVNLNGSDLVKGKQALDLMSFLPGINVSNGKLSIWEQKPYAIYINGIAVQSDKELETLDASMIERIDISYTAGAAEAAAARGGIIRIKLKKNRGNGYAGYLLGSAEWNPHYGFLSPGASGYLSWQTGRLNITNTATWSRRKLYADEEHEKLFKQTGNDIETFERFRNTALYFHDRLNLSYDINKSSSIAASVFISTNRDKAHRNTEYTNRVAETELLHTPGTNDMLQAVANYQAQLDDKGETRIEATADFLNSRQDNKLHSASGDLTDSRSRQLMNMVRTKAQLTHKNISGGIDFRYLHYNDNATTVSNNTPQRARMNGYQPAAFITASGSVNDRLQYEAGLRWQGNLMRTNVMGAKTNDNRWLLCPTMSAMYLLDMKRRHLLSLSYSRSMDDMPYSQITTYRSYTSPEEYSVGNPALKTPTSDNIQLMARLWGKLSLVSMVMHESNSIYYTTGVSADNPGVSYTMPKNADGITIAAFMTEATLKPAKWWTTKPGVTLSLNYAKTDEYDINGQARWTFRWNNSFKFSPTAGGTLKAQLEPDSKMLDAKWRKVIDVRGSLYKYLFNNNLSLQLDFTLYRKGRSTTIDAAAYRTTINNVTKEETVALKAVWYFSGGKKVKTRNAESIQEYKTYTDSRKE